MYCQSVHLGSRGRREGVYSGRAFGMGASQGLRLTPNIAYACWVFNTIMTTSAEVVNLIKILGSCRPMLTTYPNEVDETSPRNVINSTCSVSYTVAYLGRALRVSPD